MSVSLPSDKLLEVQHLAHSLLQRQPVIVHEFCLSWAKVPVVPLDMHNFSSCVVPLRVKC